MTFFDDIPDDPELAFLHLEKLFRDECTNAIDAAGFEESYTEDYLRYIESDAGGANRTRTQGT